VTEFFSSSSALSWNSPEDPFAWVAGDQSLAVPMLPDVAQRAVGLASDPDVPVFRLSDLVAKDQVLASRVMAMANSAASAPSMYISTIQDAVVRLGTAAVRNVVLTVSLTSRLQNKNVYGERAQELFDHALGAAYMARLVSERVESDADEDEAFLFGLMHDIGKLVILKLAYEYNRVHDKRIPAEIVDQALHERHAMMGGLALRRWKLPESVDDPVMFHHNFAAAPRRRREAAMCHLANRLCHRYGFGCPAEANDVLNDEVLDELNLDLRWLEAVDARAPGLYAVARSTFGR
jgi:HD-like signal output (HDOD) protein